jgi:hypothetical protein
MMTVARKLTAVVLVAVLVPAGVRPEDQKSGETLTFEQAFHMTHRYAESKLGAEKVKKLQAALEDVNAVLSYKKPIHARLGDGPYFFDGGTLPYEGDGYSLDVLKSRNWFGKDDQTVRGYMYGPILNLKRELGGGNDPQISRVTFYPDKLLKELLK